jgi:hypothetical protein
MNTNFRENKPSFVSIRANSMQVRNSYYYDCAF